MCPPLQALLHIMAHGHWQGKDESSPEVRGLFTRDAVLGSRWYKERLIVKQARDIALWGRHVRALDEFLALPGHRAEAERLGIHERRRYARELLDRVKSRAYLGELQGTIGADPIHRASAADVLTRADDGPDGEPLRLVK
jgi:hypothetical protein